MEPLKASVFVRQNLETVWESFTQPEHITQWYAANDS